MPVNTVDTHTVVHTEVSKRMAEYEYMKGSLQSVCQTMLLQSQRATVPYTALLSDTIVRTAVYHSHLTCIRTCKLLYSYCMIP
jgi:hypothetical protein